jgi:glucan 1,3-beta-glucosidase
MSFQAMDATPKAMTGTNIRGWLVLEPWITPSFFYRWVGKTHTEGIGMDSYTVCE